MEVRARGPNMLSVLSLKPQKERTAALTLLSFFQGYYGSEVNAIIVFAACFLPDSDREDYHEIMENLFL